MKKQTLFNEKAVVSEIGDGLKKYVEEEIFPRYERFYSHGMLHIKSVIDNNLMLAKYYDLNLEMAFVVAAFHDLGLSANRETHEKESGKILASEVKLKKFFNDEQITIMKEAVEDHRVSRKTRPRNFYGECLSDADRDFEIEILAKRQLATSIKNYPDLETGEEHFERCYEYICRRLNNEGHFNLWTNNPILVERREKFEKEFLDKDYARGIYLKEFERISKDGTLDKIKDFYEDY